MKNKLKLQKKEDEMGVLLDKLNFIFYSATIRNFIFFRFSKK